MGSVVACAMMGARYPSFHVDIAPMQLDIVVPLKDDSPSPCERWSRFLRSMNYQLRLPAPDPGPYAACTEKVESYYHPVSL